MRSTIIACAAFAALTACSAESLAPPPEAPPATTVNPPQPAPEPVVVESGTTGGDGSEIVLNTLSADEIETTQLQGELACSFARAGERDALLIARGDVASKSGAQGIVKVGSYVERIAAPGGFDGIVKGATFSGAGKTVRIALTGPATGGGESPPTPATLTYDRMDGARRTYAGNWTCGP